MFFITIISLLVSATMLLVIVGQVCYLAGRRNKFHICDIANLLVIAALLLTIMWCMYDVGHERGVNLQFAVDHQVKGGAL